MPELIAEPSRVAAAGEPPKLIDEYVSLARQPSKAGAEAPPDRTLIASSILAWPGRG
jgi:hypothetical protein